MTLSIAILSITIKNETFSIRDTEHNNTEHLVLFFRVPLYWGSLC